RSGTSNFALPACYSPQKMSAGSTCASSGGERNGTVAGESKDLCGCPGIGSHVAVIHRCSGTIRAANQAGCRSSTACRYRGLQATLCEEHPGATLRNSEVRELLG